MAAPTTLTELCCELRLPTVAHHAASLHAEAQRQKTDPLAYLEQLLTLEVDERRDRRAARRIRLTNGPASSQRA